MKKIFTLLSALFVSVCIGSASMAGVVSQNDVVLSGDGTETCVRLIYAPTNPPCSIMEVTPHPAWHIDQNAKWISYDPTGWTPDDTYVPPNVNNAPYLRVVEQFFTYTDRLILNLDVWADDTAAVYFNGNQVYAPNFTNSICADGPIGCETGEQGHLTLSLLKGLNVLEIDVYQTGTNPGNPTATMFSGDISAVPIPSSVLMLLGAFGGMYLLKSRKNSA